MTTTLSTIDLVAASAATFVIAIVITADKLTEELRGFADRHVSTFIHSERVPHWIAFAVFKLSQLYECPHCVAAWVAAGVTYSLNGFDVWTWFIVWAAARLAIFWAGWKP